MCVKYDIDIQLKQEGCNVIVSIVCLLKNKSITNQLNLKFLQYRLTKCYFVHSSSPNRIKDKRCHASRDFVRDLCWFSDFHIYSLSRDKQESMYRLGTGVYLMIVAASLVYMCNLMEQGPSNLDYCYGGIGGV